MAAAFGTDDSTEPSPGTETLSDLISIIRNFKEEVKKDLQEIKVDIQNMKKATNCMKCVSEQLEQSIKAKCEFPYFMKLPAELRMAIWKIAVPSNRIFEPCIEPFRRDLTGTSQPNEQLTPRAPLVKLIRRYKPPYLRQICQESRQASDEIGGFEFGLFKTSQRGCWFHHTKDTVFIHSDMIDKLHYMDLIRVQNLAYPNSRFQTEERCEQIIENVYRYSPRCQRVFFCFLSTTAQEETSTFSTLSSAKFVKLRDDDVVGHYTLPGRGLPTGPLRWREVHRAIIQIWEEYKESSASEIELPSLVGMNVLQVRRFI